MSVKRGENVNKLSRRQQTFLSILVVTLAVLAWNIGPSAAQTTASARGSGKVPAQYCDAFSSCSVSGSGATYSFSFSGDPSTAIPGSVTFHDADMGVRVESVTVTGNIDTSLNTVNWSGTCELSTSAGTSTAPCTGFAQDVGEPGGNDRAIIHVFNALFTVLLVDGCCEYLSGGAQID
jgi:hypothetical protein